MKELTYRVPRPHCLRLTLEDCTLCLKNLKDPMLYSAAINHGKDQSEELLELKEAHELFRKTKESMDEEVDTTESKALIGKCATNCYLDQIHLSTDRNKNINLFVEIWLNDYFEEEEGGSVARCEIYRYFVENCHIYSITPCNAANFGKVMRSVFPNIQTRRIGIRGHSKYHYVGIAPKVKNGKITESVAQKQSSVFRNHRDPSVEPGIPHLGDIHSAEHHDDVADILVLLSEFPSAENVTDTDFIKELSEFIQIYKLHVVRLIYIILQADFYKVKDLLEKFWRHLPLSLFVLMGEKSFIDVTKACDIILYRVISDIMIPDVTKPLPTGLMQALTDFVENYLYWLQEVLCDFPSAFKDRKLEVCTKFKKSMHRRIKISQMASTARLMLQNGDYIKGMLHDWQEVDVSDIVVHCQKLITNNIQLENKIRSHMVILQQLLIQRSAIDEYFSWINSIVCKNIQNMKIPQINSPLITMSDFMLDWSYVSGQIIQQLAVNMAPSLGLFHLLDLLLKDYALYLIEEHIM